MDKITLIGEKKMIYKKALSVLLAAVLFLTLLLPLANAQEVKNIVEIDMRGFMSYTIYEDKNDPNSSPAFPPSPDKIKKTVKQLIPAMTELAVSRN